MVQHVILVDPHGPGSQRITNSDSSIQTSGMHRGCETISGGVSKANGIIFGLELGDGADGAEDFLLHYLHVFGDVGEDCGLDEVAFFAVAFAADFDFGAFFLAGVDVSEILLE